MCLIVTERPDDRAYWIGGQRENDVWVWEGRYTGSLDYNFWDRGQPGGENCMMMKRKGLRFRNYGCGLRGGNGGICETVSVVLNTDS